MGKTAVQKAENGGSPTRDLLFGKGGKGGATQVLFLPFLGSPGWGEGVEAGCWVNQPRVFAIVDVSGGLI